MAEHINLAFPSIGKIETGDAPLKLEHMRDFAQILGVYPADLLSLADGGLSKDERDLIRIMRSLPKMNLEAVTAVIRSQEQFCQPES